MGYFWDIIYREALRAREFNFYRSLLSVHSVQCQLSISSLIRAFDELKVKHEQLQLITPQFETPLPPLQPAVCFHFILVHFRCCHVVMLRTGEFPLSR